MSKKVITFKDDPVYVEIKSHIQNYLGSNGVNIELAEEDLATVVKDALRELAPYYDGRRYVQGNGNHFDLSAHNPICISNVYNTNSGSVIDATQLVFGAQNMIIYDTSFKERLFTYLSYKQLLNEFQALRPQSWRYIAPYLILDNFNGEVLIEMVVNPVVPSDVERSSQYFPWIFNYALAGAKEILGRERSKYRVDSAPFTLDGDTLLQEAAAEKARLKDELVGPIFIL